MTKKILEKVTYLGIIAALCVAFFIQSKCKRDRVPEKPELSVQVFRDTIPGDRIPYKVEIDKPYPVFIQLPPDTVMKDVDTAAILLKYFTLHAYQDTLLDDTSALIVLFDTVTKNELGQRTLMFQNRRNTILNTYYYNYGEKPRNKFYVGLTVGRDYRDLTVGASMLFVSKTKYACSYTFDALNLDHYFSFYYKLDFNKKVTSPIPQ